MIDAGNHFGDAAQSGQVDPVAFIKAVREKWTALAKGYNEAQIRYEQEERLAVTVGDGVIGLYLHSLKQPDLKVMEVVLGFDASIKQFNLKLFAEDKSEGEDNLLPALPVREYLFAPNKDQVGEMVGRYAGVVEDSIGLFYASVAMVEPPQAHPAPAVG